MMPTVMADAIIMSRIGKTSQAVWVDCTTGRRKGQWKIACENGRTSPLFLLIIMIYCASLSNRKNKFQKTEKKTCFYEIHLI